MFDFLKEVLRFRPEHVHGDLKDRLSDAGKSRLNAAYATFQKEMDYIIAQKCTSDEFEQNIGMLCVCVCARKPLSLCLFVSLSASLSLSHSVAVLCVML